MILSSNLARPIARRPALVVAVALAWSALDARVADAYPTMLARMLDASGLATGEIDFLSGCAAVGGLAAEAAEDRADEVEAEAARALEAEFLTRALAQLEAAGLDAAALRWRVGVQNRAIAQQSARIYLGADPEIVLRQAYADCLDLEETLQRETMRRETADEPGASVGVEEQPTTQ